MQWEQPGLTIENISQLLLNRCLQENWLLISGSGFHVDSVGFCGTNWATFKQLLYGNSEQWFCCMAHFLYAWVLYLISPLLILHYLLCMTRYPASSLQWSWLKEIHGWPTNIQVSQFWSFRHKEATIEATVIIITGCCTDMYERSCFSIILTYFLIFSAVLIASYMHSIFMPRRQ